MLRRLILSLVLLTQLPITFASLDEIDKMTDGMGTFSVSIKNSTSKNEKIIVSAIVSPFPVSQESATLATSSSVKTVKANSTLDIPMQKPLVGKLPTYTTTKERPSLENSEVVVTVRKLSDPDADLFYQTKAEYLSETLIVQIKDLAFTLK